MLRCLRIRHLALIEHLELELGPGLTVVTGETGAGKSMLIDALELVFGGKSHAEHVRQGAAAAEVEASFDLHSCPESLRTELEERDLIDEDDALTLRRVVTDGGRSRAYINGRQVPRATLAQAAALLADIASQHEHHMLAQPQAHRHYLDAFAKADDVLASYRDAYQRWIRLKTTLESLVHSADERERQSDFLRFQLDEIEALLSEVDDEERLFQEVARERHGERLAREAGGAATALIDAEDALVDGLRRVERTLSELARVDGSLALIAETFNSHVLGIEEAGRELSRYADAVTVDVPRAEALSALVDRLVKLKRKYGPDLDSIRAFAEAARTELGELESAESTTGEVRVELKQVQSEVLRLGKLLSVRRTQAAAHLSTRISALLHDLGMGEARVVVDVAARLASGSAGHSALHEASLRQERAGAEDMLTESAQNGSMVSSPLDENQRALAATSAQPLPGPFGLDDVAFLIAPNRGEALRPLHSVASGGELSRSLLAIKCALAETAPRTLYVFDEVDAGVGGAVGEVIGTKLSALGTHQQVLCITHLPQIAAYGTTHIHVAKTSEGTRTHSHARHLDRVERQREIARMLGGINVTATTEALAAELIADAQARVSQAAMPLQSTLPSTNKQANNRQNYTKPSGDEPRAPRPRRRA